ncbi:MAG TPA: hypothetical protein VFD89_03930 [Clostridia bacterium]|nr:hypothetical protein [Clostridia bacterium]
MARKSYYHRSFIILKPESRGYGSIPDKAPTGYCKFEIRRGIGKAYIYIQDIKSSSSLDGAYEAYLISADDSIRPCKLAGLYADEQGRCEHIVSFDADDIKGSGYTLESFHALVIAYRTGTEGMGIAYPLIGYAGKDIYMSTQRITAGLKALYGEEIELLSAPEPRHEPSDYQEAGGPAEIEVADRKEAEYIEKADPTTDGDEGVGSRPGTETGPAEEETIEEAAEEEAIEEKAVEEEAIEEEAAEEGLPAWEEPGIGPAAESDSGPETEIITEGLPQSEAPAEDPSRHQIGIEPELQPADAFMPDINLEPLTIYPGRSSPPPDEGTGQQTGSGEQPEEEQQGKSEEQLRRAYEDSYQEYLQDLAYEDKTYPHYGATYWDNVKDYFIGLFKAHQRVFPFGEGQDDIEWIRVQQATAGSSGYFAESSYGYPSYNYNYPDHHIVGIAKIEGRVQYVVYGMPSMYSMIPPISINGFSRWVPIKGGFGMGYWLLYIDAISGRIVYP